MSSSLLSKSVDWPYFLRDLHEYFQENNNTITHKGMLNYLEMDPKKNSRRNLRQGLPSHPSPYFIQSQSINHWSDGPTRNTNMINIVSADNLTPCAAAPPACMMMTTRTCFFMFHWQVFNSSLSGQNDPHFADNIFECIFMKSLYLNSNFAEICS